MIFVKSEFTLFLPPHSDRLLFAVEATEIRLNSVFGDLNNPLVLFLHPSDAWRSRPIALANTCISVVFGHGNIPQIVYSVIIPDAVDMIDRLKRERAIINSPSCNVSFYTLRVYGYLQIPI